MTSIREMISQIKSQSGQSVRQGDLVLFLLIVLIVGGSFGLGRLSVIENSRSEVRVGEIDLPTMPAAAYEALQQQEKGKSTTIETVRSTDVVLVASKSGSAYHYPWCPGAKQMKEENKIYFGSFEEALTAGYRAAQNCPGLE